MIRSHSTSHLLILLMVSTLVFSCGYTDEESPPDISAIEVDWQLRRFDQALFQVDTNDIASGLAALERVYSEFAPLYFDRVLGASHPSVAQIGRDTYIKGFLSFPPVRKLYDTIQVVYPTLDPEREAFDRAFRYLKYYFPQRETPNVTAFVSEFSYQAFIYGEDELAIGLEFFLGADFPYQELHPTNPNFSAYLTRAFNRDHLVAKGLQPLIEDMTGSIAGDRLLDHMILNGKKLFILDRLLPEVSDTVIMEVSAEQWTWLQAHEGDMWAFFLTESPEVGKPDENLLYSSDWATIRKYLEYSPHSPGMPAEAPGRTASYMGWQVVKAWMQRHPDATMSDLIELRDAQRLLTESKYKPAK